MFIAFNIHVGKLSEWLIAILCESLFTTTAGEVTGSRAMVNILYGISLLCFSLLLGPTLMLPSRCARGVETVLGVERQGEESIIH